MQRLSQHCLVPAGLMLGLLLASTSLVQAGQAGHDAAMADPDAAVPLFTGLGEHRFPITTDSDMAQRYFDQGLMFIYGFNHFEAVRAFQESVRHDPECALCFWGVALAQGPHINAPMMPEAVAPAFEALQRAQALAVRSSEREQAYIEALGVRYEAEPPADRTPLDRAYADAMGDLVAAYPDDLDAATLYAEALMNLVPWNYWDEKGAPRTETEVLVATLESVLERDPAHPGATHYYIHAMENSPYPERAEAAADRLRELNISIGHMIHMPSHIYAQVGRWHDASQVNVGAIDDDRSYLAEHEVQGLVPLLYHPHNLHFLAWTAGMEGRNAIAYRAATELVVATPVEQAASLPFLYNFLAMPALSLVRFGQWEAILDSPAPAAEAPFLAGIDHYARGRAYAALDQQAAAEEAAAQLSALVESEEGQALEMPEAFFPGASILTIADRLLQAELALRQGEAESAVALLEEAVSRQDALPYFEPPYWFASARLELGRTLLELERAEEAEAVYREDLDEYPHNGWALFGLAESLRAQGRDEDAEKVAARAEVAWQYADIEWAVLGRQ